MPVQVRLTSAATLGIAIAGLHFWPEFNLHQPFPSTYYLKSSKAEKCSYFSRNTFISRWSSDMPSRLYDSSIKGYFARRTQFSSWRSTFARTPRNVALLWILLGLLLSLIDRVPVPGTQRWLYLPSIIFTLLSEISKWTCWLNSSSPTIFRFYYWDNS